MIRVLTVSVMRDEEAGVWVAVSDDVPGLASEAASYEALRARVLAVTPELLHDNARLAGDLADADIRLRFEDVVQLDRSATPQTRSSGRPAVRASFDGGASST